MAAALVETRPSRFLETLVPKKNRSKRNNPNAFAASESSSLSKQLVGLKVDPPADAQRAPIDIVVVLDVSESMTGQKLDLARVAVHCVIDNLGDSDQLSIVAFSDEAMRVLPLRRMTESSREDAHRVVCQLVRLDGTDIVKGLAEGVKVLDERRHTNSVSSIIFLSDGNDTKSRNPHSYLNLSGEPRKPGNHPPYLNMLPVSIYPKHRGKLGTIPVFSFAFGRDHDPVTMHAISEASGGICSIIGSIEKVQDAVAGCIGPLKARSAVIKSFTSVDIMNKGSENIVNTKIDEDEDEDEEMGLEDWVIDLELEAKKREDVCRSARTRGGDSRLGAKKEETEMSLQIPLISEESERYFLAWE